MGPLTIDATGNRPIALLDFRRNRFRYFDALPIYWLGVVKSPLTSDDEARYQVTFQFPPARATGPRVSAILNSHAKDADTVLESPGFRKRLIPTPKSVTWGDVGLPGFKFEAIQPDVQNQIEPGTKQYVSRLSKELQEDYLHDIRRKIRVGDSKLPAKSSVHLKIVKEGKSHDPEEYHIRIMQESASAEASTTAGLVNACKTLRQLWQMTSDGSLPLCSIDDWPDMPIRAVHFYAGKGGKDAQLKMLRDVLGPLKINTVFYDAGNIRWESHPELYPGRSGMPKQDAQAFQREAERQHIEVVPLINTFGHSNWFLENPRYRHLADNPENPFAYDPTNPEVYQLTESIYAEAADLFKPHYFHIGHDEITLKGFPHSEHLKKIGARKLILDDIKHYRDFFARRGIRTVIWGDMFIGPGEAPDFALAPTVEEAKARRSGLPRDVVICDWHYSAAPMQDYVNLGVFNKEGLDVIGCPWYNVENLWNFAGASSLAREMPLPGTTLGIVQATWAGGTLTNNSIERSPDQFSAYVLTAEAAWSGGAAHHPEPDIDHRAVFSRMWNSDRLAEAAHAGWTIDLSPSANRKISRGGIDNSKARWIGRFQFGENAGENLINAIQFSDGLSSSPRVDDLTIPVVKRASTVFFATAATADGPPDPIAIATVSYVNGKMETISFKLGTNVYAMNDTRQSPFGVLPAGSKGGEDAQLVHVLPWRNPHTAEKISQIQIKSMRQGSGFILAGLSGNSVESRR
jgi:hypothetical protein